MIKNLHISFMQDTPRNIHTKFGYNWLIVLEEKSFEKLLTTTDNDDNNGQQEMAIIPMAMVRWAKKQNKTPFIDKLLGNNILQVFRDLPPAQPVPRAKSSADKGWAKNCRTNIISIPWICLK